MDKTPLNSWHHDHKARMVDFAGWEMPVLYNSIVDEHLAVRKAVGLFDISHMGRLEFRGPAAEDFLNQILTNDATKLKAGDIRYSLVCRPDGGILDDVLIYRLCDRWVLVVNASNREKIVAWINQQSGFRDVDFEDQTHSTAMIAVQGPSSVKLMHRLTGQDLSAMKYYSGQDLQYSGTAGLVSRTGYTGEDGFELTVPAADALRIWQSLMDLGEESCIAAAGLGCRDTLRLEAAMPLYGHELTESIDPLTAGLGFAVRLQKSDFIGKQAILTVQKNQPPQVRIGMVLDGRRIAREETPVMADGRVIGRVTSGTFSPTLQQTIAMAYVDRTYSAPGQEVQVDLRGTQVAARVTSLPFYKRSDG